MEGITGRTCVRPHSPSPPPPFPPGGFLLVSGISFRTYRGQVVWHLWIGEAGLPGLLGAASLGQEVSLLGVG